MLGNQLMQRRDPGQSLRQPLPDQHRAGIVFDLDVVMGLSPVIADEQQPSLLAHDQHRSSLEKTCYDLMDQCSPARHPTSTTGLLTTCRGTI
jgi:hypothetical protein